MGEWRKEVWYTHQWIMHARLFSHFSHVWLFVTTWTVVHQAPLTMGFFRQEYCSGLPCPPPGDLPDPGIKPTSPASLVLQADSLTTEPPGKPDGLVRSHKKEGNLSIWSNTEGPWGYYAKWSKSDRERQIPYDLTYMWNRKAKQIMNPELIYTANRLVGARDRESRVKKNGWRWSKGINFK